jgi:MFS family permease
MFGMTRVVPRILGRTGPKPLVFVGTVVLSLGLLWLRGVDPHSGYVTDILGPMLLMGLGGGLGFVPLNPVIMANVPPAEAGAAGGALQTMQQLGGTLGLAVLVTVFGAVVRTGTPGGTVHAMAVAFTVGAGIAGVAALVALTFRGRDR